MASDSKDNPLQAAFSSIDVTASTGSTDDAGDAAADVNALLAGLMRRMVAEQETSNTLLKELIGQMQAQQRGRADELGKWKKANPELANRCRVAAETLSDVQNDFLMGLTAEVEDSEDTLRDSDYMLQEFVDRYGPRLAHLNGVLQVLSQLAANDS
ncbi:MAG: hypothetical protein HOB73_15465 [Planctomycetaceae bacterium]|nr:hypothetical protein [Planctomycetaceae bacterium]